MEDRPQRDLGLEGAFEAHGERLMPLLADAAVEFSAPPEILEVHNIVRGR